MSEAAPRYPLPHEDAINAPFLDAWRDGRLLLQRCGSCHRAFFYPRAMCPHCWSVDLHWFQASGRGHVVSWSHVWKPDAAFASELPVVLVEVELEEGASMLSRVIGEDRVSVRSGALVQTVPPSEAATYPLPTFRLA